jgi:CheY-like chemotaxis protein
MSTILIVDDRETNREFLLTLLGYEGHRLLQARDGAEALDVVRHEHCHLQQTAMQREVRSSPRQGTCLLVQIARTA